MEEPQLPQPRVAQAQAAIVEQNEAHLLPQQQQPPQQLQQVLPQAQPPAEADPPLLEVNL